jgi:inhibitor of the pro-sigma K processing machinery
MADFVSLFIPVTLLMFLLRLLVLPIRWGWKLFLNSGCGFACLWLLNSVTAFTGLYFPVNYITAMIVGFLGLPGIGLLAILQNVLQ